MKVVIDTNRIIAALIRDSTTREILFNRNFEFIAPDYVMLEIKNYEGHILKVAGIAKEEFEILMALIFEHVTIVPEAEYKEFIGVCKNYIEDEKDIPYLAVCLACNAYGIWTHDPDFLKQKKVKILANIDMLRLGGQV